MMITKNKILGSLSALAVIFVLFSFAMIFETINNFTSLKTYKTYSHDEYLKICEEFKLIPDKADISLIYTKGDLYGIRLRIDECDSTDIASYFAVDILSSNEQSVYYNFEKLKNKFNEPFYVEFVNDNGSSFIDIQTQDTSNIEIFNKCT